jgi:hypothetical protein
MQKFLQYLLSRTPPPPPHPTTPFIFAIFVHLYFAAHKSVGILCVCLNGRIGAVQDYTYWGQRRTITHPQSRWVSHTIVWLLFQLRDSAYTQGRQFPPLPSFLPSPSFLCAQQFLPFYPAIPSFLPSNSFPSTQHFLALPSFLPSTFFLSTNTSFLAAWHFLPLPLGPFPNIFL